MGKQTKGRQSESEKGRAKLTEKLKTEQYEQNWIRKQASEKKDVKLYDGDSAERKCKGLRL